jgi:hypothetical protein
MQAACRLVLVAILTLGAASVAAGGTDDDQKTHIRPVFPMPYLLYLYPGACLPYGACTGPWWEERRRTRRPVAPDAANQAELDIWGTTGSPWGYVRRLPPPTPQSHIQPRYRDASTVRPEFAEPADPAPR